MVAEAPESGQSSRPLAAASRTDSSDLTGAPRADAMQRFVDTQPPDDRVSGIPHPSTLTASIGLPRALPDDRLSFACHKLLPRR